jgi:hypothetical protein
MGWLQLTWQGLAATGHGNRQAGFVLATWVRPAAESAQSVADAFSAQGLRCCVRLLGCAVGDAGGHHSMYLRLFMCGRLGLQLLKCQTDYKGCWIYVTATDCVCCVPCNCAAGCCTRSLR